MDCVVALDGLVLKEEIAFARRDCFDAFHSHARNLIREIQRVMRVHRDPFEPDVDFIWSHDKKNLR